MSRLDSKRILRQAEDGDIYQRIEVREMSRAIEIINESIKTHKDWLAYFERNPTSQLFEEYKNLGDIENHKKCIEVYNQAIEEIKQLEAENKRLRKFIEKYPSHDIQCAVFSDVAVECDCGYWQAKEQILKGA